MGKASRKSASKKQAAKAELEEEKSCDSSSGEEELGDAEEVIKINLDDIQAGKWAKEKMDEEVKRLRDMGQKSTVMKVTKLYVEHDHETETFVNCIDVDTSFDFDEISQILLSDTEACPKKEGFGFVKVVLISHEASKPPVLLPYLFDSSTTNKLTFWSFSNKEGKNSRHEVENFVEIS